MHIAPLQPRPPAGAPIGGYSLLPPVPNGRSVSTQKASEPLFPFGTAFQAKEVFRSLAFACGELL